METIHVISSLSVDIFSLVWDVQGHYCLDITGLFSYSFSKVLQLAGYYGAF